MKKIEQCDYTSWEFSDKAMLIVKGNKEVMDKIHLYVVTLMIEENDISNNTISKTIRSVEEFRKQD